MDISLAGTDDLDDLARLVWHHAAPDEQERQSAESFAEDLAAWWAEHAASHFCFVARVASQVVGMAWVALQPRVPRPGVTDRRTGDIQSVFVYPEHRGKGIGSQLVVAAIEHAEREGAGRVTVHSSRLAVTVYERLGFASSRELLHKLADS